LRQAYDYWQDQPDYYICGAEPCNGKSLLTNSNTLLTLCGSLFPKEKYDPSHMFYYLHQLETFL